jgi:anti-sigma factor RsiW
MDCSGLKQAAHAYFTGTLPASERAAFDQHAARCPECAEFVRICTEITCREVNAFLFDYVEHGLTPERRAIFDRHLAICADCRNYLESYEQTVKLARGSFETHRLALPSAVPPELVRAVFETCGLEP